MGANLWKGWHRIRSERMEIKLLSQTDQTKSKPQSQIQTKPKHINKQDQKRNKTYPAGILGAY